ncbi:hypothetical protein COV94_06505 [Candidatus Woesearchaeota archaeon CG11_big_fil_rev_8_21_14_0_20_57_5]|nr:MAG: hypothetical protein COV94_06505 [Candidatus Woesearchaeota archaeon CG11_big_fil_rev_8_21_14_0_20_57_5]
MHERVDEVFGYPREQRNLMGFFAVRSSCCLCFCSIVNDLQAQLRCQQAEHLPHNGACDASR